MLNLSSECDDQRQQLQTDGHNSISVVGMVASTVSVLPRSLRHGLDVGLSLGAKTLEGMHSTATRDSCTDQIAD